MSEARSHPTFSAIPGRTGHLYDLSTTYVMFPPCSYEELVTLEMMMWRYLYPYEVVNAINRRNNGTKSD